MFLITETYEICCIVPMITINVHVVSVKAYEDLEDRESLAQIAASQNDQTTADGETYIEKYIRGVSAVESVLTLDRLRQVGPPGGLHWNSCSAIVIYRRRAKNNCIKFF